MKHFKLMKGVLACLLSLALVVTCFTSVGAKAEETSGSGTATVTKPDPVTATFDWTTNTISAGSEAVVYVLKAKTGNAIKKGAKSVSLSKVDKSNPVVYAATMTDLGIKKAKKEVYLYVCTKEFEEAATNITANLVIKAPAAKKVTGTIDYTKADGADFNVISATAVDNSKKEIKDPEIWWSTEAEGTYYQVNDFGKADTPRKYADGKTDAPKGFDGKTLNDMLAAGGGTIYIKMAGVSGGDGTAQFGSQAVKVKIAKQAKAPKIKLDAKKDTFSLKNGFDFGYVTKDSKGEVTSIKWFTVLPQLKTAAVKTSEASVVATTNYTPLAKKDSNAGKEVTSESGVKTYSYTAYKFKALSIETVIDTFRKNKNANGQDDPLEAIDGKYYIAVRKSATEKKPASAYDIIELAVQSDKPLVYTQDNVKNEFLVATATDFDKKGIVLGTIVPNPGLLSTSGAPSGSGVTATSGYDTSFQIVTKAPDGQVIVGADTNGSSYEYAILAQKDLVATGEKAIDWSTIAWKKLDPAKTKITSKLKTKYSLIDGNKTTAQLTTESGKAASSGSGEYAPADYSSVKNFLVIRRAGDSKSSVRASNCIFLYVAKENKNYNLYSTVSNGDEAYKYTIKFVKYTGTTTGTGNSATTTYSWKVADDVEEITTWVKPGDTKKVAIAAVAGADFFKATGTGSGSGLTITLETSESGKITIPTTGTDAGKYAITIASGESGDKTEYIAIREYANVKVVNSGVTGASGDAVANSDLVVAAVANGKLATVSASGAITAPANNANVVLYVGDTTALDINDYAAPAGYLLADGGTRAVVAGDGYNIENTNGWDANDKLTVKVNTADEIKVKVTYPIVKQYKVTYDIASTLPDGASIGTNVAPSDALTNNKGKIADAAKVSGLSVTVAGEGETSDTYKVTGWKLTKDGADTDIETSNVFTADTTLYAIWTKQ